MRITQTITVKIFEKKGFLANNLQYLSILSSLQRVFFLISFKKEPTIHFEFIFIYKVK